MKQAAALLIILLWSSVAAARGAPDKPSSAPPTQAQRDKYDKKLKKQIGKPPAKLVNIFNGKTHEWLALDADEKKAPTAVEQGIANDFFRCHFTNEPSVFDRRLLGVLVGAALHFGKDQVYVVSGYRAPKYNLSLRKKGREVARDSQHSEGNAVDFRLTDVPTTALRDWARKLRLGGVGFYPESGFVHADTGKIRFWTGR